MKRLILLLALGTSAPALAQHQGHAGHGAQPQPADPHAGHAKPVAPAQKPPVDPHAGHTMPAPKPVADPHAGHAMPAPKPVAAPHAGHSMPAQKPADDPHAGHVMPAAKPAADPHAGHSMPAADPHAGHGAAAPAPPIAPAPAAASAGPAHAADAVYGAEAMADAREVLREEHGAMRTGKVLLDRLEYRGAKGRDGYAWDAQGWYGGDIHKLWLKSEGEGAFGTSLEHGEVQALWSRAIDPWFDLQLGLRHDFGHGPDRSYLALGVQGLAPYWFEVDAAAFVSEKGDISARFEAEYDLRITQKLILQPAAEVELILQDVPELGIGSGLSSAEAGLRLRYEIAPQFAPYIGVEYERGFGDTARFRRAAGERAGGWSLLAGLRAWF
jgi:copper resistance protein B